MLDEFEHHIDSITLIPSSGGVFELTVGDQLVYSKKQTQRHAEYATDVREQLARLLG